MVHACLLSLLLAVAWTRLHCWARKSTSAWSRRACALDQVSQGTCPGVGIPVGPCWSGTSPGCLALQRRLCPLENGSACPAPPSRALSWVPSCPPSYPHGSVSGVSHHIQFLSLLISHWHTLSLWVSSFSLPSSAPLSPPISVSPASSVSAISPYFLHSLTVPQLFIPAPHLSLCPSPVPFLYSLCLLSD